MIGNSSFNNQGASVFIAKYTNSGNLIWHKKYSSTAINEVGAVFRFYDVKRDNNNSIYVFGSNNNTTSPIVIEGQTIPANSSFILKYNSVGNLVYIYHNQSILKWSFCIDSQGNSYFITTSPGPLRLINKLSPTGQLLNSINFVNNDFNSPSQCFYDNQGNYIISGLKNFPGQVRGFIQKVNFNSGNTIFEFVESEATGNRVGYKFAIDNLNNIHFYTSRSMLDDYQELKYFKLSPTGDLLIQKDGTSIMSPAPVDVIFANNNLFFSTDKETNFFSEAQINNFANASGFNNVNPHCITTNLNGDFLSVQSLKSLSSIHGFYLKNFNNQIYKLFIAYGPFYNNGIQYDKGIYVVK
jgi:hypothetical protein